MFISLWIDDTIAVSSVHDVISLITAAVENRMSAHGQECAAENAIIYTCTNNLARRYTAVKCPYEYLQRIK